MLMKLTPGEDDVTMKGVYDTPIIIYQIMSHDVTLRHFLYCCGLNNSFILMKALGQKLIHPV